MIKGWKVHFFPLVVSKKHEHFILLTTQYSLYCQKSYENLTHITDNKPVKLYLNLTDSSPNKTDQMDIEG